MERKIGKCDLHEISLNDLDDCIKAVFTDLDIDHAGYELNLSLQAALDMGVSPESILSRLMIALPEPSRSKIIARLAKDNGFSEQDLEGFEAPEG